MPKVRQILNRRLWGLPGDLVAGVFVKIWFLALGVVGKSARHTHLA
jgi:hypothetical protein